jgi:hypothetical protein
MNYYNLISMMPKAPAYDADAQAFITATGISGTNASAINTLVIDLKAASIWTKMHALYPIIGGSATSHKINLKDPRDLDAAFRLSFIGGGTHSANGYLPNGVNSYANTFFNPSAITNNNHMSIYIRTNINEAKEDIGIFSGTNGFGIDSRAANVAYYLNHSSLGGTFVSFANTDSRGFHINTRNSSSSHKGFLNGVLKGTNTVVGTTSISLNIYIGCRNNGGVATFYSSKECAFASMGDGLSDAEALSFRTAVQTYQTTLGRQV